MSLQENLIKGGQSGRTAKEKRSHTRAGGANEGINIITSKIKFKNQQDKK